MSVSLYWVRIRLNRLDLLRILQPRRLVEGRGFGSSQVREPFHSCIYWHVGSDPGMLYLWAISPVFFIFHFEIESLIFPSGTRAYNLPASASVRAGIVGVYCWTQLPKAFILTSKFPQQKRGIRLKKKSNKTLTTPLFFLLELILSCPGYSAIVL